MNDMRFNEVLIQLCKESEPKMIDIGNLRTHIHPMFYLKKKKNIWTNATDSSYVSTEAPESANICVVLDLKSLCV